MFRELGSRYYQSVALSNLGDSYQATGQAQGAARARRQALNILTALNHPRADQPGAKLAQLHASHLDSPDSVPRHPCPLGFTGIRAISRSTIANRMLDRGLLNAQRGLVHSCQVQARPPTAIRRLRVISS